VYGSDGDDRLEKWGCTQSRVQFEPRDGNADGDREGTVGRRRGSTGTHIGQWSIQGYGATDLTDDIEYALERMKFGLPMQVESEHYADFVVDMPIEASFTRERVATATARILGERSMRITRQAVSVMQAFTGSIHDVTKALFFKSSEDGRHVRVDDLKYALSTLPKSRIVPERGSKGTKSAILHTLLDTDRPLSQRSGARRRLARNLRGPRRQTFAPDELAAFDLIRDARVRLGRLSDVPRGRLRRDDARRATGRAAVLRRSRRNGELPRSCCRRRRREDSLRGAIYEAAVALEPMDALGDPDHPSSARPTGRSPGATPGRGRRPAGWRTLLNAACAFVGDDPMGIGGDPDPLTTVATIGREPEQEPITSDISKQAATASD